MSGLEDKEGESDRKTHVNLLLDAMYIELATLDHVMDHVIASYHATRYYIRLLISLIHH